MSGAAGPMPDPRELRDGDRGGDAMSVEVPLARRFYWQLRRELWESRSIYLAPLAVTALIVAGALVSAFQLPARASAAAAMAPAQRYAALVERYDMVSLLLMATTFVVSLFYCLDALQSERRDRSILFWKSLPVSDLVTVLAKAAVPMAILPLLTVALVVAAQLVMLLAGSLALAVSGGDAGLLWAHVPLPTMWVMVLYHMVAVHGLAYAPIYAWLLLVSAWSRRAAWVWAILPPLAVGIVERIAFGTSHVAGLVSQRLSGGASGMEYTVAMGQAHPLAHMTPGRFLASPGLWLGFVVAAAMLAGAVRLRKRRGPV